MTTNADSSYITVNGNRVTSYVGPDATRLMQAMVLRSALIIYSEHKILVTRGASITKLLTLASKFTDKQYKRGAALNAAADMTVWIDAMRAAMPVVYQDATV